MRGSCTIASKTPALIQRLLRCSTTYQGGKSPGKSRQGQAALAIFAHCVKHVAQRMDSLRSIFLHQGQVRGDELPFFIAHLGRVGFAAFHRLLYSTQG